MNIFNTDVYTYLQSLKQINEEVVCTVDEDESFCLNPDEDETRFSDCDPIQPVELDEQCIDFDDLAGVL